MAMAPVVYALWQDYLRFDPEDPIWPNRDRFILSAGHASTLLYALLHLAGVKAVNRKYETLGQLAVPLEDLKKFRQLESKCPGHPEYRWTSGVETTTGPLGQGVATSVGMAIASKWLAERYNRPNFPMFDYDVYALAGDGCMMEGISSEAASLAGHLRLSNLCWIYDNNHITIEGNTSLAFSEDVAGRFLAYGWNVQRVSNANDLDLLREAFGHFKKTTDRPTLIIVDSHIGYGAPTKQDTSAAHGEPLGEEEIRATKKRYGWPEDAKFLVPPEVLQDFKAKLGQRGAKLRDDWMSLFAAYQKEHPELAAETFAIQRRNCRNAGFQRFRHPSRTRKESPAEIPPAKCGTRLPRSIRGWSAVPRIFSPSPKTLLTFPDALAIPWKGEISFWISRACDGSDPERISTG